MNEIDPLLRLSWFVAATAPWGAPASSSGPAVSPLPEQPPIVSAAGETELERHASMSSVLGTSVPIQSGPAPTPGIPNNPALTDTWFFGLGVTFMNSSTEAQLSGNSGAGASIDFEQAFGLAKTDFAPEALARWRFSDRWRLEMEYFSLNRSNTRVIGNDITWGDTTIPAGTNVKASFDVSVLRFSCGYSFFKTQDKEIGVALGVHLTDFKAGLDATGYSTKEGKMLAPLPVISVYGQFALTDTWSVQGRLDALRLAYDPFYGNVLSIGVDALWHPWRHLGVGLGWRTLQIGGGVSQSDWNGDIQTTYTGPILFVSSSF